MRLIRGSVGKCHRKVRVTTDVQVIGPSNTPSPTILGSGAERFYLPAIWIWHFGLEVAPSFFGDFAEFSVQQSRKIRSFCPKRAVPSPTVFWEWRSRPPPWLFFCGRPTSAQIWRACVRARAAALGPALALKHRRHGEQVCPPAPCIPTLKP